MITATSSLHFMRKVEVIINQPGCHSDLKWLVACVLNGF